MDEFKEFSAEEFLFDDPDEEETGDDADEDTDDADEDEEEI